jgi:hypothetical protein
LKVFPDKWIADDTICLEDGPENFNCIEIKMNTTVIEFSKKKPFNISKYYLGRIQVSSRLGFIYNPSNAYPLVCMDDCTIGMMRRDGGMVLNIDGYPHILT